GVDVRQGVTPELDEQLAVAIDGRGAEQLRGSRQLVGQTGLPGDELVDLGDVGVGMDVDGGVGHGGHVSLDVPDGRRVAASWGRWRLTASWLVESVPM